MVSGYPVGLPVCRSSNRVRTFLRRGCPEPMLPPVPEGQLLILRLGIASSETQPDYSVSFSWSRLGSTRTADRRCHGDSALRAFLNEVGIRPDLVDAAIMALRTSTEHRILHVYLTPEWLSQLGLNAT